MPRERIVTVHSIVIWPFVEAVRKLGITIPTLPELTDAERPGGSRIAHERARTLLELAVAVTGREDLGVLAAEAVEPGHFDLVELATRTQKSIGEGISTLASLVPILHDALLVKLVRAPEVSRLRISLDRSLQLHPSGYDFIVASLVIGGRRQTRVDTLAPLRVRLPYPRPAHTPPLARVLDCPIEFDAELLKLEFPSRVLDLPLVRADASMAHVLHEAARELIDSEHAPSELERAVREHVRDGLASNTIDAKQLAHKLHMSERTLRRKLDAEGIGLRALIDDVRRELALQQLAEPGLSTLSTEALAAQLGFTTPQAFHRAFKRWTGGTLQAFRAQRR